MGKQTKAKKQENLGKGKVTPVQIAFLVDRYLSDNNYSQTRSLFRTEASSLISRSPVQEAPKSLLSLGAIVDEYICLKEQKVILDQEKLRLEQEKLRVRTLLQGMQDVMNVYNAGGSIPPVPPAIPATAAARSMVMASPLDPCAGSPAGYPMYNTPITTAVSIPSSAGMEPTNFSTPVTNHPSTNKRKRLKAPEETLPAKRSHNHLRPKEFPDQVNCPESVGGLSVVQSSPVNQVPNGPLVQGSSVAKSLFAQPSSSPLTTSSGPKTPPQASSSQSDKSISPLECSPSANSNKNSTSWEIASIKCAVRSPDTLKASPSKQISCFSMSRSHYTSPSPLKTDTRKPSKRDHVKGRLDFDGSDAPLTLEKPNVDGNSTTEPGREMEVFDIDLSNIEAFGADFSISELLVDFDIDCEGIGFSCEPGLGTSVDSVAGSPHETNGGHFVDNRVLCEHSSTVTEILSEKDMNIQGQEVLTSVLSKTKCIRILSPAKTHRSSSSDQENLLTTN
ncbi:uncharacterized protein LOC131168105 [Malania oleifera]|uniref:uncharacterized protein LOC131168105 n=1 Tax=Malania oleifera TaxID=397392 RepID=UPI0025ADA215|nr:uncharacterized protein LOC131168105 [Malania oleifera]